MIASKEIMLKPVRHKFSVRKLILYATVIIFTALVMLPVYTLLINATRSNAEILAGFTLVPGLQFIENIKRIVESGLNVYRATLNSIIFAVSITVIGTYFSALTAYGIKAYAFKGRDQLYLIILITMMIPGQLSVIGYYRWMLYLKMTESYVSFIVSSVSSASTVFFIKQYLDASFEKALVEAARIDGAKEFYIFNRIIMPLIVPSLATMAVLMFISAWNSYLMPSLLITAKTQLYTLPIIIAMLRTSRYSTDFSIVYTGLAISLIPIIIVFAFTSKYVVQGLTIGGVKG